MKTRAVRTAPWEDEGRLCACALGKVGRRWRRWTGGVVCIKDRASSTSVWLCRGAEGRTRAGCDRVRQGGVVQGGRAKRQAGSAHRAGMRHG